MTRSNKLSDVYLETGIKRTFAGAIAWPGWCRGGRDEESALRALVDYGPRYAHVARAAELAFQAPADPSMLRIVERLEGSTTTDFGAPDAIPASDTGIFDEVELRRSRALLRACWGAFDAAVAAAQGKELSKGPRGGGRDLGKLIGHVLGADAGYLSRLAWKLKPDESATLEEQLVRTRDAILQALEAAARGELPRQGPRGGTFWPARYYVRRSMWHVLDHAWELEDRIKPQPEK